MVSATPIVPTDPRFESNGFSIVKVTPTYDYRTDLTLYITNNTVAVFRKLLDKFNKEDKVFVFLNSTDTIHDLICNLKLQGRSKVYCSEKSVKKLKRLNYSNVTDKLGDFSEVNFLTSRFYSAVDIKLEYKPNVVIFTDVFRALHSTIDPETEVVQLIGRFRNGIKRAFHITNITRHSFSPIIEKIATTPNARLTFKELFDEYHRLKSVKMFYSFESSEELCAQIEQRNPLVKIAYEQLGVSRVQALKYHVGNVKRELIKKQPVGNEYKIVKMLNTALPKQTAIPKSKVKEELQKIYTTLGLAQTAKASDLSN